MKTTRVYYFSVYFLKSELLTGARAVSGNVDRMGHSRSEIHLKTLYYIQYVGRHRKNPSWVQYIADTNAGHGSHH